MHILAKLNQPLVARLRHVHQHNTVPTAKHKFQLETLFHDSGLFLVSDGRSSLWRGVAVAGSERHGSIHDT